MFSLIKQIPADMLLDVSNSQIVFLACDEHFYRFLTFQINHQLK